MEAWKKVWRASCPMISTPGLKALKKALVEDSPELLQGATTTPPPLQCVQDWAVEAACAWGYCGWKGNDLETVGDVEEFFAKLCFDVDHVLQENAACRFYLNWFDETPRADMIREMIPEVELALESRRDKETKTA